jgi:hypothetical protein
METTITMQQKRPCHKNEIGSAKKKAILESFAFKI